MAMMIHSGKLPEGKALSISDGCNGCVTKNITFKGISAHAGGSPENGRNALYAATCALNSVNALRETFTDNDHIRFHPIITEAGLAVNAIPETAKVESYVRGASFDAIRKYNTKVNQALAASAAAIVSGARRSSSAIIPASKIRIFVPAFLGKGYAAVDKFHSGRYN